MVRHYAFLVLIHGTLLAGEPAAQPAADPVRRGAAQIIADFKVQDSNLTGEMALVKEYTTALAYLEKLAAPSDKQKQQLADYSSQTNLEQIVFHAKEVLSAYREEYDVRPATRESELKNLAARVNYVERKLLDKKAKWREPTKEEKEELLASLRELDTLLQEQAFEKIAREIFWVPPTSSPKAFERNTKGLENVIRTEWVPELKKLIASLLASPDNIFIFSDSDGVKTAQLMSVRADDSKLHKDFKGFQVKWRPNVGKRYESTRGYYNPQETGGPLRIK